MYTDFMAFMRKSGKLSDDLEAEMQVEVRASPRLASPRLAKHWSRGCLGLHPI